MERTESRPTAPAIAAPLPAVKPLHHALLVFEGAKRHSSPAEPPPLPLGWSAVLANARLSDMYAQLLGDAGVSWSAALPHDQHAAFAALCGAAGPARLIRCGRRLQLGADALPRPVSSSSVFLILSGRTFPLCDLAQAIQLHNRSRCDVTLIGLERIEPRAYRERLRVLADGRVSRIDRLYSCPRLSVEQDWSAVMVLTGSAVERLAPVSMPRWLALWPAALLRMGLRLQGHTLEGHSFDLRDRRQVHELAEALLCERPQWLCRAGMLSEKSRGVWVGSGVSIDPTAQIVGPAAIGDGVQIGPGALVVGPSIIGRNARLGAGVVLRRSLLPPDTTASNWPQASVPVSTATPPARRRRRVRLRTRVGPGRVEQMSPSQRRVFRRTKRLIDLTGSLLFLVVTLPLYPLIALAITINSPGPIFYGHWRQGLGGRRFRCWKFRTMVPNAEELKDKLRLQNEVDGPQFKIREDPRIFWFGRWLRRPNIDEWPQFFNVLCGQMSLVGPRPSPERENQMCPAWRDARLSVQPGITGLWQVSRRREVETDFQEWIYYDVQYVKKQSIRLDLLILLRTVRVLLKGS